MPRILDFSEENMDSEPNMGKRVWDILSRNNGKIFHLDPNNHYWVVIPNGSAETVDEAANSLARGGFDKCIVGNVDVGIKELKRKDLEWLKDAVEKQLEILSKTEPKVVSRYSLLKRNYAQST